MPLIHEFELKVAIEGVYYDIVPLTVAAEYLAIDIYRLKGLIYGKPKRGGAILRAVFINSRYAQDKNIYVIIDDNFREVQRHIAETYVNKTKPKKIKIRRDVREILKEIRGK